MKNLTKSQLYKVRLLVLNQIAFASRKNPPDADEIQSLLEIVRALEDLIKEVKE